MTKGKLGANKSLVFKVVEQTASGPPFVPRGAAIARHRPTLIRRFYGKIMAFF